MGSLGPRYTLPACALAAAMFLGGCPGTLPGGPYPEASVPWSYPEASLPAVDAGPVPDVFIADQKLPDSGAQDQLPLVDQLAVGDRLAAADQESAADLSSTGRWYQVDKTDCSTHCSGLGKKSAAGPEGAHCMSGEVRSASGITQGIKFTYGCWSSCTPQGNHTATSKGGYCYRPGQKQDDDDTDRTVGCFCE